jgi:hypothetical protein
MNFRLVERDAADCTVITETRVYAGGAPVVRRFAAYWRVIYPGRALMRHIWLRAIELRAEGGEVDPCGGHDATLCIEQKCSIVEM